MHVDWLPKVKGLHLEGMKSDKLNQRVFGSERHFHANKKACLVEISKGAGAGVNPVRIMSLLACI